MKKITIIGAGRVGEAAGQVIATRNLARKIVLMDINEGVAKGSALDIQETAPLFCFDTRVIGSTQAKAMQDSDLVIITAGIPRKPGMSRLDVLETNIKILDGILDNILRYAPDCMILLVSNPVDILTYHTWKRTGWDRSRIFGQAGVLDSARMAAFVALETGLSVRNINAMVLGGHGDAMVPMVRFTTIAGIPIEHFLKQEVIASIVKRSRYGGAEILALKQNSSAYDAPAAAIAEMVESIALARRQVVPVVAILQNEYGETDIAMGVPCILGEAGVEKIITLELSVEEQKMFDKTIISLKQNLLKLEHILNRAP
jgi:malate dehydrogenase